MDATIHELTELATSGDADAQFQLATFCHSSGDLANCIKWLKAASEQQHVLAMTNLAICYYFGDGVSQSFPSAWPLFQRASDLGDLSAKYYVGLCYLNGQGVAEDKQKAFNLLLQCASEGMPWAQLSAADCYRDGIGVPADSFEAVGWYARAAQHGVEEAQREFQKLYYHTDFKDHLGKRRLFWFETQEPTN